MSLRSRSSVGFQEEGKTGESGEKPLGARERNNNKLNPYMASTLGFKPGLHWWGRSAPITAPPPLPPYRDPCVAPLTNKPASGYEIGWNSKKSRRPKRWTRLRKWGGRSTFFPLPFPRLPRGSVHWPIFLFCLFLPVLSLVPT